MNSNNPLRQFFRQPSIYLKLPSNGQFYPDGTLDMPANRELPVFPMTAVDEITYRTPDALFNGSATVDVIQSCVPNIKNAWVVPGIDVDSILIAIRIASYGHSMEIGTKCPKCSHDAEFGLDLRTVLDQMNPPDYSKTLRYGDLEIFFKPMSYKNLTDNSAKQFEEQKLLQNIDAAEINPEEKLKILAQGMKKLTELTVGAMSQSISAVKTPEALVTEPEYIAEMLANCDRKMFTQIRDHVINMKEDAEIKPLRIACSECKHEYSQPFTLDMTSFFDSAS